MPDDIDFGVPDNLFNHLDTADAPLPSSTINYDDFIAKKSDEYFISIAKRGEHSFIMLGVVVNGEKKILTSVGKYVPLGWNLVLLPFTHINSSLYDDRERQNDSTINYSAYTISYHQALSFIALIEKIDDQQAIRRTQKNKEYRSIGAFRPLLPADDSQETETVTFRYDSVRHPSKINPDTDTLCSNVRHLGKCNTCRHTSVNLLNYARQSKRPDYISRQFFFDLPVQTNLIGGVPDPKIPFYILPLPPTAFPNITSNAASAKIMEKLFRRMENIITLQSNSLATETKFNKLKSLYNDLVKSKEATEANHATPEEIVTSILDSISAWRKLEVNKDVFQLRRTYFFIDDVFTRKSATEKMFDAFEGLRPN